MKGVKGVKVYRNGARTGGVQRSRTFTPYTLQAYQQVRRKAVGVLFVVMALAVMAGVAWLALDAARTATP